MRKRLIMLVGIQGSGKSTWAQNHVNFNTAWVSRDYIRFSLLDNSDDYFTHEKETYEEYVTLIQHNLSDRDEITTVIADATHLNWNSRNKLLKELDLTDVDVEIVYFDVPLSVCINRNEMREGRNYVPKSIIRRFAAMLTDPHTDPYNYSKIQVIKE